MATFKVDSTPEEQELILDVLRKQTDTIATSKIATLAHIPISRARYAMIDLEETSRIVKVPTKAFNKHYVRYRYEVVEK